MDKILAIQAISAEERTARLAKLRKEWPNRKFDCRDKDNGRRGEFVLTDGDKGDSQSDIDQMKRTAMGG